MVIGGEHCCHRALLNEAAEIAAYNPVVRFAFFWCLSIGLNDDINEVRHIFLCIKKGRCLSYLCIDVNLKVFWMCDSC